MKNSMINKIHFRVGKIKGNTDGYADYDVNELRNGVCLGYNKCVLGTYSPYICLDHIKYSL